MVTTLYSNSCFSGGMVRGLVDRPNVQAFSSSQAINYAFSMQEDLKGPNVLTSYDEHFLKKLRAGNNYLEAHNLALEEYFRITRTHLAVNNDLTSELSASVPRSSMQEYILNWCINDKKSQYIAKPPSSCRDDDLLKSVKISNALVAEFYATNPEILLCNRLASQIDELNRRKKALLQKAIQYVREQISRPYDVNKIIAEDIKYYEDAIKQTESSDPGNKKISLYKKQIELLKNMSDRRRAHRVKESYDYSIETLANYERSCIQNKTNGQLSTCNSVDVAYSLSHSLEKWGTKKSALSSSDRVKGPLAKCIEVFPSTIEGEHKKMACLEDESKNDPVAAFFQTKDTAFGKSCPLYKLAAESVLEDKSCLEKFTLRAQCENWNHMKDLVQLGSRKLAPIVTSSPTPSPSRVESK